MANQYGQTLDFILTLTLHTNLRTSTTSKARQSQKTGSLTFNDLALKAAD